MGYKLLYDATADDSDKTFTVPSDKMYHVLYAHVTYVSTATAGARQLIFRCRDDSDNTIWDVHAGTTQAANNTYQYEFGQGVYRETAVINDSLTCPIAADLFLLPGYDIRVFDSTATDAAQDDMTVAIMVKEMPIN